MPRTLPLSLLALLLPLCTTIASVPHEKYEVESQDLQGVWQATSWVWKGRNVSYPTDDYFAFSAGNRFALGWLGRKEPMAEGSYLLHPSRTPHGFDLLDRGPASKPHTLGIYRLDGNRLTLCWREGGPRPKEFVSKPGMDTVLVELVRVK